MNTLATFFASIIALFSGLVGHTFPPTTIQQPRGEVTQIIEKASSSNVVPINIGTINKNGVIYFQYTNTNNWNHDNDNGLEVDLKFMEAPNSQSKELIHMSGAKGDVYPASNFVYHDQTVYFINKDGGLSKIENSDIAKVSQIKLSLNKEEFLSDFFIRGHLIYYLSGPFCNVYMGTCNNVLKTFNTTSGTSTKLASGIKENTISGFTLNGNKIILSKGSGDGGCAWQTFLTFDLLQNIIISTNKFSWCSDEKESEMELKKKNEFENRIYPKASTIQYLNFTNGKFMHKENPDVINLITPKDGRSSLEPIRVY